jgi:chitinase
MKRIIYYYQTFVGLKDVLYTNNKVTHIHLSSIHFNNINKTPTIHLNNLSPYDKKFNQVWDDINRATQLGIKCVLMIGGSGGAFNTLFSNFEEYYLLLYNLIKNKKNITGIDLDIEENTSICNTKKLINRIYNDFGKKFIISMAPLAESLAINESGMSGFIYKELYNSEEGQKIHYFNCQFYNDFSQKLYQKIIQNGYSEEKIVMGMISSQDFEDICIQLINISTKYPNFSGVYCWEYFNSPPNSKKPAYWSETIYLLLN